jgi:2-oxoglutarate ferredoxin oxidoreductase subunit delta
MPVKGWIEVNEKFCKGCELCVQACPQHVLNVALDRLTPKGYHPAYLMADGCTGCAICAIVCPEAALAVFRETPVRPGSVARQATAGT